MIDPKVDAIVVGAGAGGGIAAKELATAGLKVVLFEKGRWYTPWDCRKDDLRNQRTTFLGNAFGPEPEERHPRVSVDLQGRERIVDPSDGAYSNNASCVGGGTLSYGAMAWRYMPQDFRMRSTYGAPEGSTLEDWPLSYDELEPFYTKANGRSGSAATTRRTRSAATSRSPCRCLPCRRRGSTRFSSPRRSSSGSIPSRFRCCATACPTTAARAACAAAGASGSPAKWMRSAGRRTR